MSQHTCGRNECQKCMEEDIEKSMRYALDRCGLSYRCLNVPSFFDDVVRLVGQGQSYLSAVAVSARRMQEKGIVAEFYGKEQDGKS